MSRHFLNNSRLPNMVEGLNDALVDGYNATIKAGVIDKGCSQVIIGFSASSSICLKSVGDFAAARVFDSLAAKLENDWTSFQESVKEAHDSLNILA